MSLDLQTKLTEIATSKDTILWAVGFVGVCVLVGMGRLDQEVLKYMVFALAGKAVSSTQNSNLISPKLELNQEPKQN